MEDGPGLIGTLQALNEDGMIRTARQSSRPWTEHALRHARLIDGPLQTNLQTKGRSTPAISARCRELGLACGSDDVRVDS